jgi:hypothetical protein
MRPKRKKEESGSYTCILGLFLLLFTSVAFAHDYEGVLVKTDVFSAELTPSINLTVPGFNHSTTNSNEIVDAKTKERLQRNILSQARPGVVFSLTYKPKHSMKRYISAMPTRVGYIKIDNDGKLVLPDEIFKHQNNQGKSTV